MTVPLHQADPQTCGGKAGSLGLLLRAGLPVPDGFVVTVDEYRAARDHEPSGAAWLLAALADGLDRLGDRPVAVRSSAADEDTAGASAAGQHDSVLAVQGLDQVAGAVRACWASLHSPRAVAYHSHQGTPGGPVMAVLVQRLVDADVSGVLFTPAARGAPTRIEASWGLGPSVVAGAVTPDAYSVADDGTVTSTITDKTTRLDRAGTGLVTHAVAGPARSRATLDDATAVGLAGLGRQVAGLLGGPQDVEWALVDGRPWVLQARPVTAELPPFQAPRPGAPLTGTPGSPGTATGPARIVRSPDDFGRVRPGDILVCPFTDPAWTPLLRLAAGVVTEVGGVLSHAAIVARERRIPAVLGVPHATTRLDDGSLVVVDGSQGTLRWSGGPPDVRS